MSKTATSKNGKKTKKVYPHEHSGNRLKECMKKKGMTIDDLLDALVNKTDKVPSLQYVSQMRTGERPISPKNAFALAECLGIEPDYLLGKDGYKSKNYEDYLILMGKEEQIEKYSPDLQRKASILDLAGYSLRANFNGKVNENTKDETISTPFSLTVTNGKSSAEIPYSEIDKIEKQVRQFAATLVDAAVVINQPKSFESGETLDEALKKIQTINK